jgi:hypothetical protein
MPLYRILTENQKLEKVDRNEFTNETELHSLVEDYAPWRTPA